jgi:hypothetical protein
VGTRPDRPFAGVRAGGAGCDPVKKESRPGRISLPMT